MSKVPIDSLFADSSSLPERDVGKPSPDWNILIVDDSNEVHELTKLVLNNFTFEGRSIHFFSAYSGQESLQLLKQHDDIALVLLDVVMETDHAGLDVAKQIREELNNSLVRIILRTGQPGQAPEEDVVINYDINDYKDKADLTSSKLKTMTVAALRAYRSLSDLDKLNDSLEHQVQERTAQLEKSKKAAEAANDAKSLFLANMSHEIRTPLNAILGFAQLSLRSQDCPKAHYDMLQSIESAGNHLLEVINDILELSKIEAGAMALDPSDFQLSALIKDLASMFAMRCEQKGLIWTLNCQFPEGAAIRGDQGKIRQVLINLLGNAVKFTDQGEVKLTVTQEDEQQFLFEVADTGPGIDPQDHDAIFDAFHQASASMHTTGTGLGLSISKRQIELMGGALTLNSKVGKGSNFSFYLRLPEASSDVVSRPQKDTRTSRLKAGSRLSALVVDDVLENRVMLSALLNDLGVEVTDASNGLEALASLRQKSVDIVFMDIRMPVMNGDEAVVQIRKEFQGENIVCVAISAYSMAHEVKYYLSVGFDRYISKPFQFDEIFEALEELCGAEFENEAVLPVTEAKEISDDDYSQLTLPGSLYSALMEAAELNRMTKIRQLLDEVEAIESGGTALSACLYRYLINYDTQGMMDMLTTIHHTSYPVRARGENNGP